MRAIAAERCIAGRDLSEPRLSADGTMLIYVVAQAEGPRLVVHRFDGGPDTELATNPPIRPGRGLGGGAWCFCGPERGVIYAAADGNLWQQLFDETTAIPLTTIGPERAVSSPHAAPDASGCAFVVDLAEVHWFSAATQRTHRVDHGDDDFCMDPFVEPDSQMIRWVAWNVPDMPWDHAHVRRAAVDGRQPTPAPVATDGPPSVGSVQQLGVMPDGRAVSVRDDTGWLNVWVGDEPVVSEPCEHGGPSWGPGQRSYAWSPDGTRLAFTRNERGFGRLCVVTLATGAVEQVARGVHGQLSWAGGRLAAIRTGACTPTQVVVYDTDTWEREVIAVGPSDEWDPADLVEPELLEVPVADGVVYARRYTSPGADGRLIVWLHGGPTDQWQVTFMPRINYWLSRGWSILVPDHRGSTGHGRDYQQALRGRWGELDVADTLAVTRFAHDQGWAQRARTVIMGSSAGGFTGLAAVAADPGRFAAAVVLFPVTDLGDLVERSHRFERHYTDSLVGPLPAAAALYRERSPAFHTDRFTLTPILLLHGDSDPVVPVEQSQVFAQRVQAAGGQIELRVYPGEGHGFRQPANQLDEYRRIEGFLARCVPVASAT